ncbi:MAG: DUF2442 domain-containing protein [Candidatus Kapabacteria bacterium]|nr:DUF2442 domain-containing protein [Candidatus Kapabacteria bacterium]
MILKVINAEYIDKYQVRLLFNHGIEKTVSLENEFYGAIFKSLQDITNFKNFKISCNTISWSNGADLAHEYL